MFQHDASSVVISGALVTAITTARATARALTARLTPRSVTHKVVAAKNETPTNELFNHK